MWPSPPPVAQRKRSHQRSLGGARAGGVRCGYARPHRRLRHSVARGPKKHPLCHHHPERVLPPHPHMHPYLCARRWPHTILLLWSGGSGAWLGRRAGFGHWSSPVSPFPFSLSTSGSGSPTLRKGRHARSSSSSSASGRSSGEMYDRRPQSLVDKRWGRCRSAGFAGETNFRHVLNHQVSSDVLREQVRWVVGAGDLIQSEVAALQPVLNHKSLTCKWRILPSPRRRQIPIAAVASVCRWTPKRIPKSAAKD